MTISESAKEAAVELVSCVYTASHPFPHASIDRDRAAEIIQQTIDAELAKARNSALEEIAKHFEEHERIFTQTNAGQVAQVVRNFKRG